MINQLILSLKKIVQRQPKSLFVLSANASELLPQYEATDEANHFIEDLFMNIDVGNSKLLQLGYA